MKGENQAAQKGESGKADSQDYQECGLSNVTLVGIVVRKCPLCGEPKKRKFGFNEGEKG
jgi:hypothetical protein